MTRNDGRPPFISLRIDLTRKQALLGLICVLVAGLSAKLLADSMTMTTYYPSPVGIYRRLTTTAKTILARDVENVGIGTVNPQAKLDVNGVIAPGRFSFDPTGIDGGIYFNQPTQTFMGYKGGAWSPIGETSIRTAYGISWAWRFPVAYAGCDATEMVTGGGGTCTSGAGWNFIYGSFPSNNGWYVYCDTPVGQVTTAQAWALCAKQ
jgi:hypothetical protein